MQVLVLILEVFHLGGEIYLPHQLLQTLVFLTAFPLQLVVASFQGLQALLEAGLHLLHQSLVVMDDSFDLVGVDVGGGRGVISGKGDCCFFLLIAAGGFKKDSVTLLLPQHYIFPVDLGEGWESSN